MHPGSDHPQCQLIKVGVAIMVKKGWLVETLKHYTIVVTTTYRLVS